MKRLKSIALSVIVFTQTVKSQNNHHRYYLEGQAGIGIQQNNFTSGAGGAFGFFISNNKSIDLRAREIFNFHEKNMIGAISVTYRYHFKNGLFIGSGFAHHHQISAVKFLEDPAESTMGTHHDIQHRSGIAAEIGYNFKPLSKKGFFNCVYPTTNIAATYMLKDKGPNPLVMFNFGIRIGLNKL